MMKTSSHISSPGLTQNTTLLYHLLLGEWSQLPLQNSTLSSWQMKIDWIFNHRVKAYLNPWPTMLLEDEVVPSRDVVAVAHHVEEVTLVAEVEETPSRLRTIFYRVNFLAEQTTLYSSARSALIRITWGKRNVPIQCSHMEFI
jgi:hypothetical protein